MKCSYQDLRTQSASLSYYGECRPAHETAWDYFEFLPLEEQNLVCSLGKVTGSGITASFTMASLQAFLRGLTRHHLGSLAAVVRDLNRTVYEIAPDSFYASLFYAAIDTSRGQLQYCSAGHGPVLLIRRTGARVYWLENTGTVLGLSLRVTYRERTVDLEAGDLLVAMSEGVTDALPQDGIVRIVERHADARPATLVGEILDRTPGTGDRTALAIRFQGRGEASLIERQEVELAYSAA